MLCGEILLRSAQGTFKSEFRIQSIPLFNSFDPVGFEIPHVCVFLDEPFTVGNGLLTPKMSIKRPLVVKKYKDLIEQAYAGKIGHRISTISK